MKLIIAAFVILGLSAGGFFYWKNGPGEQNEKQHGGRPTTATVEYRSIRFEVNAAGDIGPADQVSVRPEVNGRIEELPVDIGDKVKKGALLCRLDDRDLQIERSHRLDRNRRRPAAARRRPSATSTRSEAAALQTI